MSIRAMSECVCPCTHYIYIRESVDSLCRDGADVQYMQYLRKYIYIYIYI